MKSFVVWCLLVLCVCLERSVSFILFNPGNSPKQQDLSKAPFVGQLNGNAPPINGYLPNKKNRKGKNKNKGKLPKNNKPEDVVQSPEPPGTTKPPTFKTFVKYKEQIAYLIRYGYLLEKDVENREAVQESVTLFQEMWRLNKTGNFTKEVIDLMRQPRCGCKDIEIDEVTRNRRIHKRFALHPLGGWKNRNLTFRILPFKDKMLFSFKGGLRMPEMFKREKLKAIRRAFKAWDRVSRITFTEVFDDRPVITPDIVVDDPFDDHIDVLFAAYDHGDPIPFDGPLGSLGHAFWPAYGGDLHLDESERWATGKKLPNVDLFQVAIHELGHSLGLGHTTVFKAIMYPFYRLRKKVRFNADDINGINALYP